MKLSEMKASPDVGRPEQTYSICAAGKLVRELKAADEAFFEAQDALEAEQRRAEERAEGGGRPTRLGEASALPELERAARDAAEVADAIRARMQEHTVDLTLRTWLPGEWRQWVAKHPSRDEDADPAGHSRDQQWAGGFCDIDALIEDLGSVSLSGERIITAYGDEPPADDSWAFLLANAAPGDLTRLASTVVGMHEQGVDLGKSRRGWQDSRMTALASK